MMKQGWIGAVLVVLGGGAVLAGDLPKVRKGHPRIFLRAKAWNGPSVEKIKSWADQPEYKAKFQKVRDKLKENGPKNVKYATLWLFEGDREAGKKALGRFMTQRTSGHTPSYWAVSYTHLTLPTN